MAGFTDTVTVNFNNSNNFIFRLTFLAAGILIEIISKS